MKMYISEKDMPKNKDFKCKGCEFIEHISATQKVCKPTGTHGHGNNGDCPLQSLEQHDNEVRREFAKEIKAEMEREKVSPSAAFICGIQHCQIVVDDLLKQYEVEE